jgi:flagellar motor switch protein FliN
MTANASNSLRPELQAWIQAWKSCTQDVLSQVSGQPAAFESVPEPLAASDTDLHYAVTATGAAQGEMALRLAPSSALRLSRKFLGEPEPTPAEGSAPVLTEENREALEELLRQIAGIVSTSVGSLVGGQVQLALARADAPCAWASDAVFLLRTRNEAGVEIALEIRLSPTLATSLASRVQESSATAGPQDANPSPSVPPVGASSVAQSNNSAISDTLAFDAQAANYRRLLDVGLGVKLRFGTRRMALRDVLALSSGLVVELDNKLNSPVDLLLDGRIVARGEVVVIDGKYGLRVTDVVDSSPGGAD